MKLLEALSELVQKTQPSISKARLVYFAISDSGGETAYLSQVPPEELLEILEAWCRSRREAMSAEEGTVH